MRARLAVVALLLAAVPACGGAAAKPTSGGNVPCEADGKGSTDLTKKPALQISKGDPPKETTVVDIVCGTGDEVKDGSVAIIKYVGALYDGTELSSTWRDNTTATVKVGSDTITGFTTGLLGMKVGGRRQVTIPPKDGLGDEERGPVPPGSTLVFVLDLVEIKPPPAPTPCTPSGTGSTDLTKKPSVTRHTAPTPAETTVTDIVCGTGAEAVAGSSVSVQYVGTLYVDGKEFDASWNTGEPLPFTIGIGVVPGFSTGVTGMKVGGRREVVIPAKDGYGAEGKPPSIPPNAALVFVIDLVNVS